MELIIEVRSSQVNSGSLHLKLEVSDCLTVDSILVMNHSYDYLSGYFGFIIHSQLEFAL